MRITNAVLILGTLGLVAACSTGSANPSDGSAPSVRIDAPLPGDTVGRQVSIDVTATDDFGVDVVIFKVDGSELTRQFTPPFHFVWNTSSVADSSTHSIQVDALDVAKNRGVQSISVTVIKETQ